MFSVLQEPFSSFRISKELYKIITSKLSRTNKVLNDMLETSLVDQKIPLISPLFHEDNFVTDFKETTNFFIRFLGSILW